MSEHLNELLSSYVDDDVNALERMKVEAHLAGCAECRAAVDDLRQMVRRAAALDDRPPSRDLWPAIAARIASPAADVVPLAPRRRRFAFTVPQLAAAAVVLVGLSAGSASLLMRGATQQATPQDVGAVVVPVNAPPEVQISAAYDFAIRDLQRTLDLKRSRLDTATVRVLEQSLQVIDLAIRQAREALAKDPNNPYLSNHFQRALDRKLDLLRQATTLTVAS